MVYQKFELEVPGQLTGPAELSVYCQEPLVEGTKRRAVLIIPGGGYSHVSRKEGEPVAMHFASMGYQAFVLRYSVAPNVYPTALRETEAAFALIQARAASWSLDLDRMFLIGFSAGGHLALDYVLERSEETLKPAGLILSYPVVTSGEHAHRGSFENLAGAADEHLKEELLEKLSLEKHIDAEKLPPVFLWSTWTDETVPVENTLMLAAALKRAGVNTELHVYNEGGHGLCLANEVTSEGRADRNVRSVRNWTQLLKHWLDKF